MREMTSEQRTLIRRVRDILPELNSIAAIEERVCDAGGSDVLEAFYRAHNMADYQEIWHCAPEGTDAARIAFRRWDDYAAQKLGRITDGLPEDGEDAQSEIRRRLKGLYYNSPPGGATRRLVIDWLIRLVR